MINVASPDKTTGYNAVPMVLVKYNDEFIKDLNEDTYVLSTMYEGIAKFAATLKPGMRYMRFIISGIKDKPL